MLLFVGREMLKGVLNVQLRDEGLNKKIGTRLHRSRV